MSKRPMPPRKGVELYVLRLYDGFENHWIDITKPIPYEEALARWNKETKNGTRQTCYGDNDYYDIFPANTRMVF